METLNNLFLGFELALAPEVLLVCLVGVTLGTFVGVLPGVGALTTIALCLPLTFQMSPLPGLVMLAGIFYGAQYGSSITSILLNVPGSAPAAMTCLDGHPMARQGRAGVAIITAMISSFLGGTLAILLLILFAPILAQWAVHFSSADYFSIMLLALVAAASLGIGSVVKGLIMVFFGLLLSTVGTDLATGSFRYTFGVAALSDGISLPALAMGLFGVAEIFKNMVRPQQISKKSFAVNWRSLLPTLEDFSLFWRPCLRGSAIGSFIGMLPGTGPTIAAFLSYAMEKKVSSKPQGFGTGRIEGVAAPEAANNASVQAAFIPTLTLGIPGDPIMAILIAGLLIHNISPGPQMLQEHPDLFWGVVASFWIGNVILLVLNIPFIRLWVSVLHISPKTLYPAMLLLIVLGVYSVNLTSFDVFVCVFFGLIGYFLNQQQYPTAPLLLGFVLGGPVEENFRRALQLSNGDMSIFIKEPVSASFLFIIIILLLLPILSIPMIGKKRG